MHGPNCTVLQHRSWFHCPSKKSLKKRECADIHVHVEEKKGRSASEENRFEESCGAQSLKRFDDIDAGIESWASWYKKTLFDFQVPSKKIEHIRQDNSSHFRQSKKVENLQENKELLSRFTFDISDVFFRWFLGLLTQQPGGCNVADSSALSALRYELSVWTSYSHCR